MQGSITDILLLLSNQPDNWEKTFNDIVDSDEFTKAIVKANEGAAWIGLICLDEEVPRQTDRLSDLQEQLFRELVQAKAAVVSGAPLDFESIQSYMTDLQSCFETLSSSLRRDIGSYSP